MKYVFKMIGKTYGFISVMNDELKCPSCNGELQEGELKFGSVKMHVLVCRGCLTIWKVEKVQS